MVMEPPERFKVPSCKVVRSRVVVALSFVLNSLWKPAQVEVELNCVSQAEVKPVPVSEVLTTRVSMKAEVAFKEAILEEPVRRIGLLEVGER